jgi:hypothetical protein
VIGANATGLDTTLQRARRTRTQIKVMMEEKIATYSRYGLPFVLSGKISSFDKLNVYPESHTVS